MAIIENDAPTATPTTETVNGRRKIYVDCLLYTSDAADE